MSTKQYTIKTTINSIDFFYASQEEKGNELHVEWTRRQAKAHKFDSRADVEAFKEKFPVIKGRIVIYKGV